MLYIAINADLEFPGDGLRGYTHDPLLERAPQLQPWAFFDFSSFPFGERHEYGRWSGMT